MWNKRSSTCRHTHRAKHINSCRFFHFFYLRKKERERKRFKVSLCARDLSSSPSFLSDERVEGRKGTRKNSWPVMFIHFFCLPCSLFANMFQFLWQPYERMKEVDFSCVCLLLSCLSFAFFCRSERNCRQEHRAKEWVEKEEVLPRVSLSNLIESIHLYKSYTRPVSSRE